MSQDAAPVEETAGVAELRIDAGPLLAAQVSRVSVSANGGDAQQLTLNGETGTFDGSLILAAGPNTLVARAFASSPFGLDTLVGESRPVAVQIQTGLVTRAMINILALDAEPDPTFGPIFDSLTFPPTGEAGLPVTFTISALVPGGTASYAWSSDCDDATFSAPNAATTGFAKAEQGSCRVTATASANGFSLSRSFSIAVFPAGTTAGAAEVSATFVTQPRVSIRLAELNCEWNGFGDASCAASIASPTFTQYELNVFNWGASAPGPVSVSDDCGGRFGLISRGSDSIFGHWLPPAGGGLCVITARAVNADGLERIASIALLTRPGALPAGPKPSAGFQLDQPFGFGCSVEDIFSPRFCTLRTGQLVNMMGGVNWHGSHPESVTFTDTCANIDARSENTFNPFQLRWTTPNDLGRECTAVIRATNLEGQVSEAVMHYALE